MTREELRAGIRGELERRGYAVVPAREVWEAFTGPGEDPSVSFDDALRGFAAVNGWRVRKGDAGPAGTIAFYPARQEPPPFVVPQEA